MWRVALFSLAVFLVPSLAMSQGTFGLKIASNFYSPRNDLAWVLPRPGMEIGFSSRFQVSESNAHRLMIDMGYVLGNAPIQVNNNNYISLYSGLPIDQTVFPIVDANTLSHFFNVGGYYYFTPNKNDIVSFYIGPELNYLLAYTTIVEYDAGGEVPVQEAITHDAGKISTRNFINLRYGLDVSIIRKGKQDFKLYLNLCNQLNQQPFLPVGAFIGLKWYINALTRSVN